MGDMVKHLWETTLPGIRAAYTQNNFAERQSQEGPSSQAGRTQARPPHSPASVPVGSVSSTPSPKKNRKNYPAKSPNGKSPNQGGARNKVAVTGVFFDSTTHTNRRLEVLSFDSVGHASNARTDAKETPCAAAAIRKNKLANDKAGWRGQNDEPPYLTKGRHPMEFAAYYGTTQPFGSETSLDLEEEEEEEEEVFDM